jgi:hypothetical protein
VAITLRDESFAEGSYRGEEDASVDDVGGGKIWNMPVGGDMGTRSMILMYSLRGQVKRCGRIRSVFVDWENFVRRI